MKKIIVMLLVCVLTLGVCACKKDDGYIDDGHKSDVTETRDYIIKSGKTDYKILIPDNARRYEKMAAEELALFYELATGVRLDIINDKNMIYTDNAKYLSIGNNNYSCSAGIDVYSGEDDGFIIKTKGMSVFMIGATDKGSLNSVYEFMNITIGFEAISVDEYNIKHMDNVKFKNIDVRESPDFKYRYFPCVGVANCYPEFVNRTRTLSWRDEYIFPNYGGDGYEGSWWDTTLALLPKDIYYDEHPDWYNTQGNDVCFSNEEMLDFAAERLMEFIEKVPERNFIMFGMSDVTDGCHCEKCEAATKKYGTYSSVVVLAANRIMSKIRPWFKEKFPNRPMIQLGIFVYYASLEPPVKKDKNGNWVPTYPEMIADEDVFFLCPPIYSDYSVPYNDDKNFDIAGRPIEGWGALGKNLTVWSYNTNFNNYMYFFDVFNSQQANMRFCKDSGANGYYEQTYTSPYGREGGLGGTAWFELKIYLSSKLMWNVDLDYEKLIDNYFQAQFREAAPFMREFFDGERNINAYNRVVNSLSDTIYYNLAQPKLWPKNELVRWSKLFDDAFSAIEKYKEIDYALYVKLYNHICVEKLSLDFMLLTLYPDLYSTNELYEARKHFKSETERLNMTYYREGNGEMKDIFDKWGV